MNQIKIIFFDVDGTLTDGKIYMGPQGEAMKAFDIKDGYGIYRLFPDHGVIPVIITGRFSEIVENRCKELGVVEVHQGILDKKTALLNIAKKYGLQPGVDGRIEECAYIGDDLIDLPGMALCRIVGCPSDSVQEVKDIANYVCAHSGGNGAVREFIDWIIGNQCPSNIE